jgi:type II secretory pathway pseudopilin PulG
MRRHQRGAALLIAVALLGLLAIATLARALSAPADNAAQLATERALARASDALAAYGALGNAAGNHNNSPGALPCPDIDGNDGESDFSCSGHIGRLPWKTLGMGPLLDGAGECLWYARSATFSNNIQTSQRGSSADKPPLNPATPGGIVEVSALGPTGARVAAVIIAPGRALSGQARTGGLGNPGCRDGSIEQFVESATIDGVTYSHVAGGHAITTAASGEFNDSVLTLSTSRLFTSAGARVLGDISLSTDGTPVHEWWANNLWCGHVCASGGAGVIVLADGSRVTRNLPVLPACAGLCSGS